MRLNFIGKKENFPLIVGLGIPVLITLIVFVFAYLLPSVYIKPSYKILYTSDNYRHDNIVIKDGTIEMDCPVNDLNCDQPTLYIYDFKDGSSTPVSFNTAQRFTLDPSDVSPDGYKLVQADNRSYSYGFPLFWVSSYSTKSFALSKGMFTKVYPIENNIYAYRPNFIGWITNGEPNITPIINYR